MKGTYFLVINLQRNTHLNIGAIGRISFREGFYIYIGSAMGEKGSTTLINRVKRHLGLNKKKKIHWHIDYLLDSENASIIKIFLIPSTERLECIFSKEIEELCEKIIPNFGSSDCNCKSHLFYFSKLNQIPFI